MSRPYLICISTGLVVLASLFSSAVGHEKFDVTIIVIDAVTGEPVPGIVFEAVGPAGNVIARGITDNSGTLILQLSRGSYVIRAGINIFGFNASVSAVYMTIDKPQEIKVYVSAVLIPFRLLPLVIYGGVGAVLACIAYGVVKTIWKPIPSPVAQSFTMLEELDALMERLRDPALEKGQRQRAIERYSLIAGILDDRYGTVDGLFKGLEKYFRRRY